MNQPYCFRHARYIRGATETRYRIRLLDGPQFVGVVEEQYGTPEGQPAECVTDNLHGCAVILI